MDEKRTRKKTKKHNEQLLKQQQQQTCAAREVEGVKRREGLDPVEPVFRYVQH